MHFKFFKQPDSMDCGPTCLKMVASYYGKDLKLETLRKKSQVGKEGVSALGISQAAESIGFRTQSVRIDYKSLVTEALLPAILYWNQNHFVVLYKAKKRKLYVADPGTGLLEYSPEELQSHWINNKEEGTEEGIALLLEPTPAFYKYIEEPEEEPSKYSFRNVFSYLLPYKSLMGQLLLGIIIASLLQLFLPFLTQSIVDVGVSTANIHFVYIVLMAQIALVTGRLAVEFVRSWILLHISTRINISILTDFLIKLMKLPISYFDSKKTGDILQRMNDHKRIETFLTGASLNVLFSLVTLIVFSFTLAFFDTFIFSVFIAASILYSLWVILFLKKRRDLDYKRFHVASKEQSATIQMVQGMQEIKLNGIEKPIRWNWERLQARLFRLGMKGLALNQWQQAGAFFINEGKNIFITFLSARAVIDGEITIGAMLAIQYIIGQLNSPIEQMIGFIQSWQNAKISFERLHEIHTVDDEEPEQKQLLKELPAAFSRAIVGGKALHELSHLFPQASFVFDNKVAKPAEEPPDTITAPVSAIHFRSVSFAYPGAGNDPVLKDINLTIPVGKTTAIVGLSGSGKTTLLKLLLKFYEPQKGEIRLDNTQLAHISHSSWRGHCGVVMQESYIFSDTIARNIAPGNETIDTGRLEEAIAIANIGEFIEGLPLGLNTKVGAEGMGISMGQKQRLLIARAVYREPEFIFFDEATNSLDAKNESVIVHNLNRFLRGKTVVIVAHRLSTVKHADQIIVLNNGIVTEHGTHEELVNLKSEYFNLVKNQLELGK